MILAWLIIVPAAGALAAWVLARRSEPAARWLSLAAMAAQLVLACVLWGRSAGPLEIAGGGAWIAQFQAPWIPQLGVTFHLAADGLSLLMVLLTGFLGVLSVAASWSGIRYRVGFFHLNLLLVLAGVTGVFLAMDLFLFYFFWELMLIPMYFLIDIWGHENRHYAAIKFFLFTQLSGLLMLLAILGLFFIHHRNTGQYTFDYPLLLGESLSPAAGMWLMLGFFVAFAVKLPAVPLHTWLPDAHTEAPTAGSVVLAGLLLKTGAYGMIRFVVPLFPQAAHQFAPVGLVLGAIGILYGAMLAFAQTDLKRLVAYTSVSHLGFVLLGVFAWNRLALQGAVMQMICHGISTGALFILVGGIADRIGSRDLGRMGGFWSAAPRMGAAAMFFAMASLGLPGLGNFVGEFLVLLGTYKVSVALTAVAVAGLVIATVYSLWIIYRAFHGPYRDVPLVAPHEGHGLPASPGRRDSLPASAGMKGKLPDLGAREGAVMIAMIAAIVWLGLAPQGVLNTSNAALDGFQNAAAIVKMENPKIHDAAGQEPRRAASTPGAATEGGGR